MKLRSTLMERPWILAVLVAIGVIGWITSGMISGERGSPLETAADVGGNAELAAPRVQVKALSAQPITRIISVNGRSAPARTVIIKTETDGRVTAINAQRGQRINRGDLIMRLDMRDRQARLEQARAAVTQHETAYLGQVKLKNDGYISDTQIAETLANLESARAELVRAELDLEYTEIRAPFDGVIQERDVEIGDFVTRGDPVVTFADNTRIIVTGSIAEQDAAYVKQGVPAEARLITGQNTAGRIRYVAPVADEATRTFTVEMEIANPDGSLPAGVTAEMRIPGGDLLAQRVSPSLLTLNSNGEIGVKTLDEFNRVVFNPVVIANAETDGVWITGLPEEANVITLGQGYVDVGVEVRPVYAEPETALAAEKMK